MRGMKGISLISRETKVMKEIKSMRIK
jgi:hypothetical protein